MECLVTPIFVDRPWPNWLSGTFRLTLSTSTYWHRTTFSFLETMSGRMIVEPVSERMPAAGNRVDRTPSSVRASQQILAAGSTRGLLRLSVRGAPVRMAVGPQMRQKVWSRAAPVREPSRVLPALDPLPDTTPNSRDGRGVRLESNTRRSADVLMEELYSIKLLRFPWSFPFVSNSAEAMPAPGPTARGGSLSTVGMEPWFARRQTAPSIRLSESPSPNCCWHKR